MHVLLRHVTFQTYDATNQVPDSGATATAMLCGAKAPFGTVGLTQHAKESQCKPDPNSNKQQTQTSILDWSLEEGWEFNLYLHPLP